MLSNKCFDQILTPPNCGNRKLAGSQCYAVHFATQVEEKSLSWLCSSTGNGFFNIKNSTAEFHYFSEPIPLPLWSGKISQFIKLLL